MSNKNNVWMWASAALLISTILTGYYALDYQNRLNSLQADYDTLYESVSAMQGSLDDLTILVDLKIDYGDTIVWYNETRVPLNSKLLDAMELLLPLNYTTSDFGVMINEINSVGGDSSYFWLWYYYNNGWQFSFEGVQQYTLKDGDIIMWEYTDTFPF